MAAVGGARFSPIYVLLTPSLVKSPLRGVVPDRLVGTRREYVPVSSGATVLAAHGSNKPTPGTTWHYYLRCS